MNAKDMIEAVVNGKHPSVVLDEAPVNRSKNTVVVGIMDSIKSDLVKAGWKHQQLGAVDSYTNKIDAAKAEKEVTTILSRNGLKGFHNKQDDDTMTEWYFDHPKFRKFGATMTHYKGEPDISISVQDRT